MSTQIRARVQIGKDRRALRALRQAQEKGESP